MTNSGIAFGLFDEGGDALVLAFTVAALALILGWFALRHRPRPWLWLGVGLLSGGALGNLADRIRDGAVTDFLDPPLWPAFNVADVAITVGVVVIALAALAPAPRPSRRAAMSAEPRLVHVDERLAVVDKPAGLVVHPAPGHRGDDPRRRARRPARRRRGRAPGDRPPARPRHLRADDRRPRRRGAPAPRGDDQAPRGRPRLPGPDRGPPALALGDDRRPARPRPPGAREARRARAAARARRAPTSPCSRRCRPTRLVEARLETGRTHQIRAHFAAIGHPVAGDPRYGHAGRHGLERQFLHSAGSRFEHPFTGERLEFESELPRGPRGGAGAGARQAVRLYTPARQ